MQRALLLTAMACLAISPLHAQDAPRPAAAILREFRSIAMPSVSDGNSKEAIAAFHRAIEDACRRQGELALELFAGHPDHPQLPDLLMKRWAGMTNALHKADAVLAELQPLLLRDDLPPAVRTEAMRARAQAALVSAAVPVKDKLARISEALSAGDDDERLGVMLVELAGKHVSDPQLMRQILELAVDRWPDSAWVARPARALLRQLDRIGQPLALAFDDVLGGGRVDVGATGSSHVLVFVWSGDPKYTRGQLEALQKLQQREPGLAVVGVCTRQLDGGAEALAAVLRKRGIDWPHSYCGGEETKAWAVPQVPFCFLLDGGSGEVVGVGSEVDRIADRLRSLRML